jgi:hypothetical protein
LRAAYRGNRGHQCGNQSQTHGIIWSQCALGVVYPSEDSAPSPHVRGTGPSCRRACPFSERTPICVTATDPPPAAEIAGALVRGRSSLILQACRKTNCPRFERPALRLPLSFVRCRVFYRGAVAPRVTAALLGRFLPRLGPLASRRRPFFVAVQGAIRWEQRGFRTLEGLFVINNRKE